MTLELKLDGIAQRCAARTDCNAVQFALASPSRGWSWAWTAPASPRQFFIASATKLYVSALVMQLRRAGRIDIDRPATQYLAPDIMAGIHVLRGIDSSARVTVRDLLAHTSGIADYFEQKRNDGGTTFERALAQDFSWSFADVLRITKEQMSPRFAPSSPGRAAYSDTNYQILGALIEAVTGETWEDAVRRRVIEPLGLVGTYPFTHATVER